MDEGGPVSYLLLANATPVYASGGEIAGRVKRQVVSIHERGVDLSIAVRELASLQEPRGERTVRWDLQKSPMGVWKEIAAWMLAHLPHDHPARDARVKEAQERLSARRRALRLARKDPRLAVEAGIGRPELSRADDGGVIDVNHASAAAIATLPGIDEPLAQQIIETRDAIDGFASLEELGLVLDLPGDVVERLRDQSVFLPDYQS